MSIHVPFSMTDHRKAALLGLVQAQATDPVRALQAIEALERMDMGAYGYCTACGMKIPEASLETRPERQHCSACEAAAAA